jgi:putative ABC transport system permease protein
MLKNYYTIATRVLFKDKLFSVIKILGLAVGMSSCALIIFYILYHLSFDDFHERAENIYRIQNNIYKPGGNVEKSAMGNPAMGPEIKRSCPEVIDFVRLWSVGGMEGGPVVLKYDDKNFLEENYFFADESFFKIFSFPLLEGDVRTALAEPNTAVISELTAKKYFGNASGVGKTFSISSGEVSIPFLVTGIYRDIPSNSHFSADFLLSFKTVDNLFGGKENLESDWSTSQFYTYLLLNPTSNAKSLEARLPEIIKKFKGEYLQKMNFREDYLLQNVKDIHLKSDLMGEIKENGSPVSINFLYFLAFFILVIACVNYVNLSTVNSISRAKEIGVRSVLGAHRSALIRQFFLESVLQNIIAVVMAILILTVSLPYFIEFTQTAINFSSIFDSKALIAFAILLITSICFSGIYPPLKIASIRPITILKGKFMNSAKGGGFKKNLVVFQFSISLILIIATFTIYKQLMFMRSQNLGFSMEETLVLRAPQSVKEDSSYAANVETFRNELLKYPSIINVSGSTTIPGTQISIIKARRQGGSEKETINSRLLGIDENYFDLFEVNMVEGRNFANSQPDYQAVILNEAAANLLGFTNYREALNQRIFARYPDQNSEVIGIVKNFHHNSLKNSFEPVIFYFREKTSCTGYFSVKLNTKDYHHAISLVESKFKEIFPGNPFDFFFLNTFFNQQYKSDQLFGKIFTFFSGLAIFIACLGLFGLSSFIVVKRSKEVGVRKVFGASVKNLFFLLYKDFITTTSISILVGCALSYFAIKEWLSNYSFRIPISWDLFFIPSFIILSIAVFTVLFHIIRLLKVNPIVVLKEE